jgi:hypothetical protein
MTWWSDDTITNRPLCIALLKILNRSVQALDRLIFSGRMTSYDNG